jgi:hypothetical protein
MKVTADKIHEALCNFARMIAELDKKIAAWDIVIAAKGYLEDKEKHDWVEDRRVAISRRESLIYASEAFKAEHVVREAEINKVIRGN